MDPSVVKFDIPFEVLLSRLQQNMPALHGIATGAIIFSDYQDQQRVLLIQRAAQDSMPNKWEIAGGGVDAGETVLEGLAREVREESGLRLARVRGLVSTPGADGETETERLLGGHLFLTRRGRQFVKYTFVVDVDDASKVKLEPKEHQDYVWATEHDCRCKRVRRQDGSQVELHFTTRAQEDAILQAFADYKAPGNT